MQLSPANPTQNPCDGVAQMHDTKNYGFFSF